MPIQNLQSQLKYFFNDRGILLQALTHTSYSHENLQEKPISLRDNERMEFLGDAILDAILTDILLEAFPNAQEGPLSKIRASLVNEKTLAEIARKVGIQDAVRLGKGELRTHGNEKPSILSSTMEAVIAAIYLDGGFQAEYPIVRHLFSSYIQADQGRNPFVDHKTQLQELSQARHRQTPTYILLGSEGPDHAKVFEIEVRLASQTLAIAKGPSKKEAEQNAARAAIESVSGNA